MKKIGSSLLIAIFAGAITLGAYKLFVEKTNYAIVTDDNSTSIINTSLTTASAKGNGINEVDFTSAAETTVNAVVHVKNVTISKGPTSLMEFFYGYEGKQKAQIGSGSGVIISSDGHIVTNNHVIKGASQLQVTLNNNKTYDAELIGTDPNSDIALLKIDAKKQLPYLAFGDSDNVRVGEWVLAVGNPFNLTSTVTAGIVSAKARAFKSDQSFIQTDAAVNPGNSGGALVNTNGDLIGINTAISSQTGSYVGYSFAVPSNIAKKVIDDIMEYGNVLKGYIGINPPRLNSPYALENGLNEIEGVYIARVREDSGADDAELQEGDIIKRVDEIKVRRFADLTGYVSTKRPGDSIELVIERNGDLLTVPVTLKERQTLIVPEMGFEIKSLNDEDRKLYKTKKGVKIVGVPEVYRDYGLYEKVIIAIDNDEIKDIQDAKTLFGRISRHGKTSITLLNKDGERERLIFQ